MFNLFSNKKLQNVLKEKYNSLNTDESKIGYIRTIMNFGVNPKFSYVNLDDNVSLTTKLAYTFYDKKEELIDIMKYLDPSVVDGIKSYKLPIDYNKKDVIGILTYKDYVKYDRIMLEQFLKNKHIVSTDCTPLIGKAISDGHTNFYDIDEYHDLSSYVKNELDSSLLKISNRSLFPIEYIKKNIKTFSSNVLDHLYEYIGEILSYKIFPKEYQLKYLKTKSFNFVVGEMLDYM